MDKKLLEHDVKEDTGVKPRLDEKSNNEMWTILIKAITPVFVIVFLIYMCDNINLEEDPLPSRNQMYHAINEFFTVEDGRFVVTEIRKESGENSDLFYVTFEVENVGKKEITIGSGMVKMIDDQGRIFEPEWDSKWPGSLNPGIKGSGKAIFEIPKNATGLIIAFRTDLFDFGGADYGYVKIQ